MKTTTALIVIFYLFVLHCYSQENDSIHARIENNYLQYLKEDKYTSLYRMKNKRLLRTLHSAITELNIQEKGNVYILNYYKCDNSEYLLLGCAPKLLIKRYGFFSEISENNIVGYDTTSFNYPCIILGVLGVKYYKLQKENAVIPPYMTWAYYMKSNYTDFISEVFNERPVLNIEGSDTTYLRLHYDPSIYCFKKVHNKFVIQESMTECKSIIFDKNRER